MEILAYSLAILAGFTLGVMGSGGSILTVPILVYLMHFDMVAASAFSLFIVGVSSLFGSIRQMGKRNIDFRIAIYFGVPSLISVLLVRSFVIPRIPDEIFGIYNGKDLFMMLLFVLLMLVASIAMLLESPKCEEGAETKPRPGLLLTLGLIEGVITGLVGAGGGFLIVPVLVLWCKMDIKKAIGTSLFMVAIKSLVGFLGHLETGAAVDWQVMFMFAGFTIIGILIGIAFSSKIESHKLKRSFAFFILVMAVFILCKELMKFIG